MRVLSYVHLRNIYRSTGVGRVAREMTEHLASRPELELRVLADRRDYDQVIERVGPPWTDFSYSFLQHETSRQQALWYLTDRPRAEHFWPAVEVVYCTAESYVPVRRAKLVVTSHDAQLFDPEAHAQTRTLARQRFKWRLLFNRIAQKADAIHAISHFAAERMEHFFPALRGRMRIIPNAVSQSFFEPPTARGQQVLTKLALTGTRYILVPGGLHFRKNAGLILDVWPQIQAQLPDLKLVIINHNNPEYVPRAEALADRGLVLAGFQEEQEIVALYHAAELVWFPSRYEGFGLPVVEAMACGTPVVTSDTTGIPEVAGGAAAALLDPDRPNEHVDAILGLMGDDQARAAAKERGRARAALFRWERSADLLVEEFRNLL